MEEITPTTPAAQAAPALPTDLERIKAFTPDALQPWTSVRNARDLGRAVARRRKDLGLGLVEASALCDVGTRFLAELERGKATVEFDRALRVAERFGLRLGIGIAGGKPGPVSGEGSDLSPTAKTTQTTQP